MDFSSPVVQRETYHKVQLAVSYALSEMQLHGLRDNMKVEQVLDHVARQVIHHFRTWALGGNIQTVYFRKTASFRVPASGWDHVKHGLATMLDQWGWQRLSDMVFWRITYRFEEKTVTDSQEVATHVCPHVSVRVPEGDRVHFDFLRGNDEPMDIQEPRDWRDTGPFNTE